MKLCRNGPLKILLCAFEFQFINIVYDVTAAIFVGKMREKLITAIDIDPIFLTFGMQIPAHITMFGVANQRLAS